MRMLNVAAWTVAQYHCSENRMNKPFNPILGETFEFVVPNRYKYISEQVSHHPPISAGWTTSEDYEMWCNTRMKTNFWGKSIELKPLGLIHLVFKKFDDEHYLIERASSVVQNIIFGNMYLEHSGTMTVKNLKTGHRAAVEFKKSGWSGKDKDKVEGKIMDKENKVLARIEGTWTGGIFASGTEDSSIS